MKAFLTFGTLVLVSAPLYAQSAGISAQSKAGPAVAYAFASGQNCPVDLAARRTPDGGLVQTAPAERHREQGLLVYFTPLHLNGIAQASLTVHGIVGPHVIFASEGAAGQSTEKFQVAPHGSDHLRYTSTVYMKRLTGVDYVEVTALTFADGSQWHSSAASVCRVTPNGFRLVATSH